METRESGGNSEAKPCLSKESWYDSSGEMMDNVRLWILSMVSLRYAANFEIPPAVEQDHQVVISEHESGSVLDINEELNRTSKENDQREQQRHHRVLLQKNL